MGAQWLSRYSVGLALRRSQVQTLATSYRRISVGKNIRKSMLIIGFPEYTGADVLVKSVEFKVPTARAYDVAEVNCWVPAQVSTSSLDRGSKLRGVSCVKAPHGG